MKNETARKERRRSQILDAAAEIFGKRGYWKAEIESIARKIGVGKGTIYLYFRNKEALFDALIDRCLEELLERMKAETKADGDALEKIRRSIGVYLVFFEEHFPYFNIMIHEKPRFGQQWARKFWDRLLEICAVMDPLYRESVRQGRVRALPVRDIWFLLLGMLHGAIHQWLLSERAYPLRGRAGQIADLFFDGIRRRP